MSEGEDLLNGLCFAQSPLPISTGIELQYRCSTKCSLIVNGSGREHQINLPYFVRQLTPSELGITWVPLCNILRQHGIPLFSSVAALQEVPAASVPARWGIRYINEPIEGTEVTTADAFELSCQDRSRSEWGWSSELRPEQMGALVSAVREAAGGDIPIGISLPLGAHADDLRHALAAGADFISLIARTARLQATDVHGLVHCRKLANQLSRNHLPILVTAKIASQEQAHKLLALGASAVCIDDLLRPLIAEALEARSTSITSGTGMLSGMMPLASSKPLTLANVSTALVDFQLQLVERLNSVGARDMRSFTSHVLRSCSRQAQQITGVLPLVTP